MLNGFILQKLATSCLKESVRTIARRLAQLVTITSQLVETSREQGENITRLGQEQHEQFEELRQQERERFEQEMTAFRELR